MSVKTNLEIKRNAETSWGIKEHSNFTYKDLYDLNIFNEAYLLPLSVIGQIDLNSFFAQVEQVRLKLRSDQPIVCAQWNSVIAVSYSAKDYGVERMDTIKEAKKKCPNLIVAHAAVYKKGSREWGYLKGYPSQNHHKVSLDPYRMESRKILKILCSECDLVEKSSIDESYLDFGRMVFRKLLKYFPFLSENNFDSYLPKIPKQINKSIQWSGYIFPTEDEENFFVDSLSWKHEIEDWDDICFMIGSQLLFDIRKKIYDYFSYTTSGGLGRNKQIAKLACGFKKPDNQTIVRNRLIHNFFKNFNLTNLTGMGGKVGKIIHEKLNVPLNVKSLCYIKENYTHDKLRHLITDEIFSFEKLIDILNGNNKQQLTYRYDCKSFSSSKNFFSNKSIKFLSDVFEWVEMFISDIVNRINDLDEETITISMLQQFKNKNFFITRPKTISIFLMFHSYEKYIKQMPFKICESLYDFRKFAENQSFSMIKEALKRNTEFKKFLNGEPYKEISKETFDPKKIRIIPIGYISVLFTNLVKLNCVNLIKSFFNNESQFADVRNKELLNEINNEVKKKNNDTHIKKKKNEISDLERNYIKSLFKEFENSNFQKEDLISPKKSKITLDIKKKKDIYDHKNSKITNFFKKTLLTINENLTSTNKNKKNVFMQANHNSKKDIVSTLKKIEKESLYFKTLFNELREKNFCSQCNMEIHDIFLHYDFHYAVNLDQQINSNSNYEK